MKRVKILAVIADWNKEKTMGQATNDIKERPNWLTGMKLAS